MPTHASITSVLESGMLTSHLGVLLTRTYTGNMNIDQDMQLEIHVAYCPPEIPLNPKSKPCARVEQIVIRSRKLWTRLWDTPDDNAHDSVETRMTRLQNLRTVTLETPDAYQLADHADGFLYASGRLHFRTCEEAQQVAQAAVQNPSGYAEGGGVMSPLWYSDKYEDREREKWCVNRLPIAARPFSIRTDHLRMQVGTSQQRGAHICYVNIRSRAGR